MKNRIVQKQGIGALVRQNLRMARRSGLSDLGAVALGRLREMTIRFGFSLAMGDFKYLDGGWYVTHSGLVSLASRRRCYGIHVQQVRESCDPSTDRWVFKSIVYKSPGSKGFVGYGDADPTNTSPLVRGAEMRVAETRAVNRALRKAYRYRYLDGWREKETRAAMVFGRCFEKALGAYFCQEDSAAVLFKEWDSYRDAPFEFRKGESWDRLFHQGVHLLETFARDNRVRIRNPKKNLQIKM